MPYLLGVVVTRRSPKPKSWVRFLQDLPSITSYQISLIGRMLGSEPSG